jgi:hypothetical protein
MSNLQYKIGDVFEGLEESNKNTITIDNIGELTSEYYITCPNEGFKNGYFDDEWIDLYYKQVINLKVKDMNIEENKHHQLWEGMQSIDVMKAVLTHEEYIGFLKGNILKYQLRVGKKDNLTKEKQKINDYTNELNRALNK